MPIQVKFCGFTNAEDVIFADSFGINKAGFIFAPKSPRHNPVNEKTRLLIADLKDQIPNVQLAAVIADINQKEIEALIRWEIFSIFQFHWDLAMLKGLVKTFQKNPDKKIKYFFDLKEKEIKIWLSLSFDNLAKFLADRDFWQNSGVSGIVLDSLSENQYGGTGRIININDERIHNLSVLLKLDFVCEIFLAGGLTPSNIKDILEMWKESWEKAKATKIFPMEGIASSRQKFPFDGIDLSSGIEVKIEGERPRKDRYLVEKFFMELNNFFQEEDI